MGVGMGMLLRIVRPYWYIKIHDKNKAQIFFSYTTTPWLTGHMHLSNSINNLKGVT